MTSRKLTHLADTRYPHLPRREAVEAVRRDLSREIAEAEEKARQEREALEQQRREAEAAARVERMAQAEAVIEAVDPASRIPGCTGSAGVHTHMRGSGIPVTAPTANNTEPSTGYRPRRLLMNPFAVMLGALLLGSLGGGSDKQGADEC